MLGWQLRLASSPAFCRDTSRSRTPRERPFLYGKIILMKKYLLFALIGIFFIVAYTEDSAFFKQKVFVKAYPSVLNFGDVMFDRGVRNIIENRGRDPFEYIKKDLSLLSEYDVVIANLEGPIVQMDRALCQQKVYNFQFGIDTPQRLKSIGINMVTLANNHSYDCLSAGYESTKKFLEQAGIAYMDSKNIEKSYVLRNIEGKKIAFVGIDETVQVIPLTSFYEVIRKLDVENDYVVVNIHWGLEYELVESANQRSIAHKLIDSGADVIVGHHPHVVQPMEVYKGKVIFYSLGNFVFDQNFGNTTIGLGVGFEFRDDKTLFTLYPYNMKIFAPDLMEGEEQSKFCEKYLAEVSNKACSFEL